MAYVHIPSAAFRKHETLWGPSTGLIYFVEASHAGSVWVKVGFTTGDPRRRLKALQIGCPLHLHLRGFCLGTELGEKELHDVLSSDCVHGEWFRLSEYANRIIERELAVCDDSAAGAFLASIRSGRLN